MNASEDRERATIAGSGSGSAPQVIRIVGLAFAVYGALTLASLGYGALTGGLRSPLLAILGLTCGALALTTGLLVRAGAPAARIVLLAWAASLFALNVSSRAQAGGIDALSLGVGTLVLAALVFALHRAIGHTSVQPGAGG